MTRLIDADELRKKMFNSVFLQDTGMQKWDSGCWLRYKLFENKLKATPTVDAEPVRHGRWVKLDMHKGMADHKCTSCGMEVYVPTSWGEPLYGYCPVCGAKMDEGDDDEAD